MYQSLQSGRAIAAILVLLFHLGGAIALEKYFGIQEFAIPFSFGDSGVEFFFVLSGFIIYHVHKYDLGKPRRLGGYVYKRITRVYPVYVIVFMGVYGFAFLSPQLRDALPHDLGLIIKSLLLIPQNKDLVGGTGAPVLIVAWTLQFEMMFYLAFSLGIINKRAGILLIGGYILGVLFFRGEQSFPFSFIFSEYVLLFLLGMMVAWLISHKSITKINPRVFALTGLLVYILTAFGVIVGSDISQALRTVLYGIGLSFIVLAMIRYEIDGKVLLKNRFFQLLGSASYALYLIHFPLISILCKASMFVGLKNYGLLGALVAYCFIFITCIAVAIAFHLIIEKPIAGWCRKLIMKPNKSIQRPAKATAD
jgi:exopolysaccharide production protein ExoZ